MVVADVLSGCQDMSKWLLGLFQPGSCGCCWWMLGCLWGVADVSRSLPGGSCLESSKWLIEVPRMLGSCR